MTYTILLATCAFLMQKWFKKTRFELYSEVLKNQYPKMERDTMMLVAIREINNYTELEIAKILKISEFAYRELESGTHGFTDKISRTYYLYKTNVYDVRKNLY